MRVYQSYQEQLSLRGFCELTGFSRSCLPYQFEPATQERRQARSAQLEQEQEQVKETALQQTFGYRGV